MPQEPHNSDEELAFDPAASSVQRWAAIKRLGKCRPDDAKRVLARTDDPCLLARVAAFTVLLTYWPDETVVSLALDELTAPSKPSLEATEFKEELCSSLAIFATRTRSRVGEIADAFVQVLRSEPEPSVLTAALQGLLRLANEPEHQRLGYVRSTASIDWSLISDTRAKI